MRMPKAKRLWSTCIQLKRTSDSKFTNLMVLIEKLNLCCGVKEHCKDSLIAMKEKSFRSRPLWRNSEPGLKPISARSLNNTMAFNLGHTTLYVSYSHCCLTVKYCCISHLDSLLYKGHVQNFVYRQLHIMTSQERTAQNLSIKWSNCSAVFI